MSRKSITKTLCTMCGDHSEASARKWVKTQGVKKSFRLPLCTQCAKKHKKGNNNGIR